MRVAAHPVLALCEPPGSNMRAGSCGCRADSRRAEPTSGLEPDTSRLRGECTSTCAWKAESRAPVSSGTVAFTRRQRLSRQGPAGCLADRSRTFPRPTTPGPLSLGNERYQRVLLAHPRICRTSVAAARAPGFMRERMTGFEPATFTLGE